MNEYVWKKLKEAGLVPAETDTSALNLLETCGSLMQANKLDLPTYSKWCEDGKAEETASANATTAQRKEFAQDIAAAVAAAVAPLVKQASTPAQTVDELETRAAVAANRIQPVESQINPADVFKGAGTTPPRVMKATERYTHTKGQLTYKEDGRAPWQKRGAPVVLFGGELNQPTYFDEPSQAEYAKGYAIIKWKMKQAGVPCVMTDHDMQLLKESLHDDYFVGEATKTGPDQKRRLSDFEIKTILDDSTSGGQHAVPEWFDYALITAPLLFGELFPYVNVIPVPRGSAADGAVYGTATFVSTAEGSAVTPFSTAAFISAFDTTFYPATCALEMGLDWEADAVPGIAQQIIAKIGQEAQRWLDEQIAVGDGTTEPQGIFTATGISASAENGTTGALTYNDALNMVFGMGKAARNAFGGNRTRYVLNDTQYKKFMQLATGVTGDDRPLFGMNVKAYQLGDYPVSIQQNITSGDMAFCNLGAYRLYRRQGLQFVSDETGQTNRLAHTRLVVARMRWGGQIELPTTYVVQMLNGSTT